MKYHPNSRWIRFGGPAFVLLAVMIWGLFPIYQVGPHYQRHPVWAPPQIRVGDSYSSLTVDDLERLEKIPEQRAILEEIRKLPRTLSANPIWIGSRLGPARNPLMALPIVVLAVWLMVLRAIKAI